MSAIRGASHCDFRYTLAPEGLVNSALDHLGMGALRQDWLGSFDLALYSVVANLSLGLSPIAWGLLIDFWGGRRLDWLGLTWNRYGAFFVGALVGFVATWWQCRRVPEPQAGRAADLLREAFGESVRFGRRLWPRR